MLSVADLEETEENKSAYRVMIVDDQKVMRKIIKKLLNQFGDFHVIEAENGKNAMDILCGVDDDLPDLIISDLHMDVMDGMSFCNNLRRLKNTRLNAIPVVLLTGESDRMVLEVSEQVGACMILQKPISAPELQKKLSSVVGFDLGR